MPRLASPLLVFVVVLVALAPAARAADPVEKITKLNRKALEAYDNLNFDQAKALLDEALLTAESAGVVDNPVVAHTHLAFGLVLMSGFQRTDDAKAHFRAALKIQPDVTPPGGLFNPEVQAVFDAVKAEAERPAKDEAAERPAAGAAGPKARQSSDEDEEPENLRATPAREGLGRLFAAVGVGVGGGFAKGNVETNENRPSDVDVPVGPYEWPGGFALSKLGHVTLQAGYFALPVVLFSVEARFQFVGGGPSKTPESMHCMPSCSPPGTAVAVLAKVSLFFSEGPLAPFASLGVGGGRIRQVVKLEGLTDCSGGQCYDTVAGGPFLLAAGAGAAYRVRAWSLLGSATAHFGLPDRMVNIDLLVGVGLRL